MLHAMNRKLWCGAAGAAALLGLALPVLAQATGGRTESDRATATRPAGQGPEQSDRNTPGRESRDADTAARDRSLRDADTRSDGAAAGGRTGNVNTDKLGATERTEAGREASSSRGWVRVGYDFNDDGRFDSFDYVRAQDVERIRSLSLNSGRDDARGATGMAGRDATARDDRSRDRDRLDMTRRDDMSGRDNFERSGRDTLREGSGDLARDRSQQDRDDRRMRSGEQGEGFAGSANIRSRDARRIEGRIVSLSDMDIQNESHVIAHLETTNNDRVQVDLGPRSRLGTQRDLLREGSRVTVTARQSPSLDRSMLIAQRLETNGQVITLGGFGDDRLGDERFSDGRRHSGRITSLRLASFTGHDHDHVLAHVRTGEGIISLVDLGPEQDLERFNLRLGQQISVMARDGCINGMSALIADTLETQDGRFVELQNREGDTPLRLRGRPTSPDSSGWREGGSSDRMWGESEHERSTEYRGSDSWRGSNRSGSGSLNQGTTGSMDRAPGGSAEERARIGPDAYTPAHQAPITSDPGSRGRTSSNDDADDHDDVDDDADGEDADDAADDTGTGGSGTNNSGTGTGGSSGTGGSDSGSSGSGSSGSGAGSGSSANGA